MARDLALEQRWRDRIEERSQSGLKALGAKDKMVQHLRVGLSHKMINWDQRRK